ncbi:serine/threonine-protein kinase [Anatilimnocola floriformis]|uniref:serine/threonine-protein kinase n=1 Tax=Anatilimnocola floriformis TaxID=2948575 RepID=UPI0020C1F8B3|nr:serine/threonine-protein kinase [Anatilimnocola floriformis]
MNPSDDVIADWELQLESEWQRSLVSYWQTRHLSAEYDAATCQRVLFELIALQMEYAWKQGEKTSPERMASHYEPSFRELLTPELEIKLLAEEFRLRWRFGDKPSAQHFLQQQRAISGLAVAILQMEVELQREFGWQPTQTETASSISLLAAAAPLSSADFLVQRFIGAGSMGRVYVAWQHSLGRRVAIKFLRKHFVHNAAAVERFLLEGKLAAGLRHPGIIVIHGLGRTPAGSVFIVMDWIDGPPLTPIDPQSRVELKSTLEVIAQAADAMAAAHAAGVIHCDLKPANILRGNDGRVVLSDFGLARRLNEEAVAWPRGEGTPAWIAPEQVDGCWGELGAATDVFNLTATLVWLLTGRSPHAGETTPALLASAVSGRPVSPLGDGAKNFPVALIDLCAAGLRKNPTQRLGGMVELATQLRAIASGS